MNKVGRSTEAIIECQRIIAAGGENGIVWGIWGNSYSIKMLSAEKFPRRWKLPRGISYAFATVMGDGVVLRLAKTEFLRQLDINPVFRESVEELVGTRLGLDQLCRIQVS